MTDIGLGLTYWLPKTQFNLEVTRRCAVSDHPDSFGSAAAQNSQRGPESESWRNTVTDIEISSEAVEDPSGQRSLQLDAGLWETIALTVGLDDRGFIRSINSTDARDITPLVTLLAKVVSAWLPIPKLGAVSAEGQSLESEWEGRFARLSELRKKLIARIATLLEFASSPDTAPSEVVDVGAALKVLQSQLASVSQVRRSWIANQAQVLEKRTMSLNPSDLVRFPGPQLPEAVTQNEVPTSRHAKETMSRYRFFVAIVDDSRGNLPPQAEQILIDSIALRRSRRSVVGIYIAQPQGGWQLQTDAVRHLDVVDEYSVTDYLPLDGSWFRSRKLDLNYQSDMSLKSYGVGSTSSLAPIASAAGEVLDSVATTRKELKERATADEETLAKAKTQLELLQTADEFEVLSATHALSAELATLEQREKLKATQP